MASASSGIGTFIGSSAYDPSRQQGGQNSQLLLLAGIGALILVVLIANRR